MNIESKQYRPASKLMEDRKGNCAQAVFATYGPHINEGEIDYATCMKIASAYGGGINLTGNVCGAITGALMALGLKYGEDFLKISEISKKFLDEFTLINGSIICRDLVGHEIFDNEDLRKVNNVEIFNKCKKCVDDAAQLLEKYLEKQEFVEDM